MPAGGKKISVIMPARNEEGNLPRAYEEVNAVFRGLPRYDYEVIVVDNASRDRTGEIARELCRKDPRWKYVRFSRDFGAETSISVGLRLAEGHAAINLFSDLQDPPDRIPDFIAKWEAGYDVVYGVQTERSDYSRIRAVAAKLAYRIIRFCSDIEIPADAGDFRLVDRRVIDAFNQFTERERYVRGLMYWVGFKQCPLPYAKRPRQWGRSKAPFWYCFQFALRAITSFSTKPLKMFTVFGFVVTAVSFLLSLYYAATKLMPFFYDNPPAGIPTILVLLLWNLGIMSLGIGILGEYIGNIYAETKGRPLCLIDAVENLDGPTVQARIGNPPR
jgi:glycosyltransferase involved in cell wall biosynthesis